MENQCTTKPVKKQTTSFSFNNSRVAPIRLILLKIIITNAEKIFILKNPSF